MMDIHNSRRRRYDPNDGPLSFWEIKRRVEERPVALDSRLLVFIASASTSLFTIAALLAVAF